MMIQTIACLRVLKPLNAVAPFVRTAVKLGIPSKATAPKRIVSLLEALETKRNKVMPRQEATLVHLRPVQTAVAPIMINANAYSGNTILALTQLESRAPTAPKRSGVCNAFQALEQLFVSGQSLHTLIGALWRVYNSNNLSLSYSFFKLISLITDRSFRLNSILPHVEVRYSTVRLRSALEYYQKKLVQLLPYSLPSTAANVMTTLKTIALNTNTFAALQAGTPNNYTRLSTHPSLLVATQQDNWFFGQGGIVPVLERIYEGIESNYLFYNASSYQSVKTLYRLTNSLWKIYSGQNLELSRNFTRLIDSITQKSIILRHYFRGGALAQPSALSVVNSLRFAFGGNNLQLRRSLLEVFRGITSAITKSAVDNKSYYYTHNHSSVVLVHRSLSHMTQAVGSSADSTSVAPEAKLGRLIDQRLREAQKTSAVDTQGLVKMVLGALKAEQAYQWRLQKLQKGAL